MFYPDYEEELYFKMKSLSFVLYALLLWAKKIRYFFIYLCNNEK